MAIDTEDKRRSALSWGLINIHYPVPEGSMVTADRPHVIGIYRGITISTAEALNLFNTSVINNISSKTVINNISEKTVRIFN